jgi:hypothetical protein
MKKQPSKRQGAMPVGSGDLLGHIVLRMKLGKKGKIYPLEIPVIVKFLV